MNNLGTLPCPLCQGDAVRATRPESMEGESAYWRCLSCGSAHLHPQPSRKSLHDFYEGFHRDGGVFAAFEERTAADFPAKAQLVTRYLAREGRNGPARVLDVGCGKGGFVRELARRGLPAEGIDISLPVIEEGRRRGIEGLHVGRLEGKNEWLGRFDAITAWATMEHVPCPEQFLRAACHVLKPGGLLFLDTGLAGDVVERWAPGLVQWFDAPQHLYVFSRTAMEKLLVKADFKVLRIDPHFERSTPRRVAKYIRNRVLAGVGGVFFRTALGAAAFGRMRQESKLPFGSLMLAVAQRNGTT